MISAAVAAAAGRYDAMIETMTEAELEPPIIEDLVRYGRERGWREGVESSRREGVELGRQEGVELAREALIDLLAVRGVTMEDADRERIVRETEMDRLRVWLRLAKTVGSARELFEA